MIPDMSETIGTTLDVPAPKAAPLPGELALRIHGGDYHGRVVRIRANQCTIGAAPDCTLRLSAPGLRPLHCIILRGEAGATVRRWSPDTQLNGRAFSDALLMPGDRLAIGPIELEVLDDAELTPHRRPETAASLPVGELAGEIVSQLRRDLRRTQDTRKRKVERQRLRQSRRRIKSLEAELERLQACVNSIAAIDGSSVPQPQSEATPNDLQAERGAWESERQSLLSKLQEKEQLAQGLGSTLEELRSVVNHEKSRCDEAKRQAELHQHAETVASTRLRELQDRVATLEAASQGSQNAGETTEALESAQRQVHELFAECERLREELHQANCSLAAAQCRLTEQEAALTAFRELHQHAIAELELERKTLQTQLTDAQTKFDEQSGRVAELECQLSAVAACAHDHRIAELESQLRAQSDELHATRTAKDELENAAAQSGGEWSQRERELTQRIECLERLAGNLENELRSAAADPDKIQLAEERRQNLEQQLSTAQQQWSEQRQTLEEQALSAHQQIQDMENQVASMRDALHSAHGQVRERDQLLSQIREEVRQQLALWQQERAQLLEQLGNGPDRVQSESEAWRVQPNVSQQQCLIVAEPTESEPYEDRYGDRSMLAGGHALVESRETSRPDDFQDGHDASTPNAGNVGNVLEAAGIWRNHEDTSPHECDRKEIATVDAPPPDDCAGASVPATIEAVQPTESFQLADTETTTNDAAATNSASAVPSTDDARGSGAADGGVPLPSDSTGQNEDESIETYMARLLKRVRGDAVANAFVTQQAAIEETTESPREIVDQTPEGVQPSAIEPAEFLPRKSAPEQAADVAAMRELAVSTTRQAINRSSQQRFQKHSLGTTLGACALIGLSVALFGWAFDTGNWIAWTGCGVCLAAGTVLVMRRLKLRRNAKAA